MTRKEEGEESKQQDDDLVVDEGLQRNFKEGEVEAIEQGVDEQQQQQSQNGIPTSVTVTNGNNDDKDDDDDNDEAKKRRQHMKVAADAPWTARMWEVFTTFWPLGLIAFGGPQAHVAILKDHLVDQRDWLDDTAFMELFAIGQGLPGPTSTQLVISTATSRAGPLGGLLAFFLWNLPGLIVLTICGSLIATFVDPNNPPWYLIGLPAAAISLVFKAFYAFAMKLNTLGIILSLFSCIVAILINNDYTIQPQSSQYVFPSLLVLGGLVTFLDSKRATPFSEYSKSPNKGWDRENDETFKRIGIPLWVGALIFLVWAGVLVAVIVLKDVYQVQNLYLDIFEVMYRIGSIIFGGGQVVLPMLQDEVVPKWMTKDQFLQGLGLAQSMPGPLFNFAAYLGAVYAGVPGALVAFVGLFGPGVILIFAMCPFWARLRHNDTFKAVLQGVNSTAIGLVGAACVTLWEAGVSTAADAIVFSISITLAVVFNVPAPLCILAGGIVGAILHPDAANLGQRPYCLQQGFDFGPEDEVSQRFLF